MTAHRPAGDVFRLRPLRAASDEMLHLDFLRIAASAAIVWHHSHEFLYPVAARGAVTQQTQALALFVDLFFVISGFVIAWVYAGRITDTPSFGRFMQRRIGRLVPLHWLTLAIMTALFAIVQGRGMGGQHPADLSASCLTRAALLLHGVVDCSGGSVPNGVSWSISAEMMFYLLFPLLGWLGRWRGAMEAAWAAALIAAIAAAVDAGMMWDQVHPVLRGLPSFLFGMLLFRWRGAVARLPSGSGVTVALLVAVTAAMMLGAAHLLVIALVYLLALAAVAADLRGKTSPSVRKVAPWGQLTYSIYMWHSLFILVMLNAVADKILHLSTGPMIGMMAACYALIIGWSYLSWTLFETPARRWIDRL